MKFAKLLAALLFTILPLAEAFAGTQYLFRVGSDTRSGWSNVSVVTDAAGNLTGLRVDRDNYSLARVRAGANIRIDGVDASQRALVLRGPRLDAATGGRINIDYLYNGIDGSRRNMPLDIRRLPNGTWRIYLAGGTRAIRQLYMRKNSHLLFGTIGIGEIDPGLEARNPPTRYVGDGVHSTDDQNAPQVEGDAMAARVVPPAPQADPVAPVRTERSGQAPLATI